jgi:hypothetical protein
MTLSIQWRELVETVSPSSASFGQDETRFAMVGDVPFSAIEDGTAVKSILGFSTRKAPTDTNYPLITRLPPMRCPIPSLRQAVATKISSCQFLTPAPGNQVALPTFGVAPPDSPDYPNVPVPRSIATVDPTLDPYAVYKTARLTVVFETPPFDILTETQLIALAQAQSQLNGSFFLDEFGRWTVIETVPGIEQIIRPSGNFHFANGPTTPSVINQVFPQGIVTRAQKRTVIIHWLRVPKAALMDVGQLNPAVVLTGQPWTFESQVFAARIGKVNDDYWHGYRRGEVLVRNIEVKNAMEPVPPEILGLSTGSVPRCYDVTFTLIIFQPPYDPTELNNNTYVTFGHQTVPSPVNEYFYQASRRGSPDVNDNTKWIYPEISMKALFQSL